MKQRSSLQKSPRPVAICPSLGSSDFLPHHGDAGWRHAGADLVVQQLHLGRCSGVNVFVCVICCPIPRAHTMGWVERTHNMGFLSDSGTVQEMSATRCANLIIIGGLEARDRVYNAFYTFTSVHQYVHTSTHPHAHAYRYPMPRHASDMFRCLVAECEAHQRAGRELLQELLGPLPLPVVLRLPMTGP